MAKTRDFTLTSYSSALDDESARKASMTIAVIAHGKSGTWGVEDRQEARTILDTLGLLPADDI